MANIVPLLDYRQINILMRYIAPQFKPIPFNKDFRKTLVKIVSKIINRECLNPLDKNIINIIKANIPFYQLKYVQCKQLKSIYSAKYIDLLFRDKLYIPIYDAEIKQKRDISEKVILFRKILDPYKELYDNVMVTLTENDKGSNRDNDLMNNKKYRDDIESMFYNRNLIISEKIPLSDIYGDDTSSYNKTPFYDKEYPRYKLLMKNVDECIKNQEKILSKKIQKSKIVIQYLERLYVSIIGLYYDIFSEDTLPITYQIYNEISKDKQSFNYVPTGNILIFMKNLYKNPWIPNKKYKLSIPSEEEYTYEVLKELSTIKDKVFEAYHYYFNMPLNIFLEALDNNHDIILYREKYHDHPDFAGFTDSFGILTRSRLNYIEKDVLEYPVNINQEKAGLIFLHALYHLNIHPSHEYISILGNLLLNYRDMGINLMLLDLCTRTQVSEETWELVGDVIDRDSVKTPYDVFMVYIYRVQWFYMNIR